jgi:hypothetical protein
MAGDCIHRPDERPEETMSAPHDPLADTGSVDERSGADVAESIERAEDGSRAHGPGTIESAAGDADMTQGEVVLGEGTPSAPGAGLDPRSAGSGGAQSAPGARMADRESAGEPLPGGPPFEPE